MHRCTVHPWKSQQVQAEMKKKKKKTAKQKSRRHNNLNPNGHLVLDLILKISNLLSILDGSDFKIIGLHFDACTSVSQSSFFVH